MERMGVLLAQQQVTIMQLQATRKVTHWPKYDPVLVKERQAQRMQQQKIPQYNFEVATAKVNFFDNYFK